MITILDYGINNLSSVSKAVARLGFDAKVSREVGDAEKLIIPGVGAFGTAMDHLADVAPSIRAFAAEGRPLMGICLGMQLLFDSSRELGEHRGLGLLRGTIKYLPKADGLKVPHMGWSPLSYRSDSGLAHGGTDGEQVYFVHSLFADCRDPGDIVATATHGTEFPAAVMRGNVWGTQFHPEKSGAVGMRILRQFLEC